MLLLAEKTAQKIQQFNKCQKEYNLRHETWSNE